MGPQRVTAQVVDNNPLCRAQAPRLLPIRSSDDLISL